MKFHLTAIFTNLVVIFITMYLYSFIIVSIDEAYFAKKGHYFEVCFSYSMLFFSWASTFIIYKIKKRSTHFYYFLCLNILGLIIFAIFPYIPDIHSHSFELYGLFHSLKSAIIETIIPIVVISKCVSVSQNIIGKKLLPVRYC